MVTTSPVETSWVTRLRSSVMVERSRLAFGAALSGSIGFVLVIAIGLLTGQVQDGLTAALGALIVGFANLGGAYRSRAATLLCTSAAVGLAALLGGLTGDVVLLTIVVSAVWGFAGGLLVALGPGAGFVGMLSTWTMVVAADKGVDASGAVHQAALIAAGAVVQTLVALIAWPLRSSAPQRRATARAVSALAAYARRPEHDLLEASAAALAEAAVVARESADPVERRRVEQADRVRVQLTALARTAAGDDVRAAAAQDLTMLAAGGEPTFAELRRRIDSIDEPAVRHRAHALLERLTSLTLRATRPAAGTPASAPARHPYRQTLSTLAGELTLRSTAFRHGLRVAVALVVAIAAYRLIPLDWGYWVPVTVLFVLKPDYGTTLGRVIARVVGTVLGVAAAAVVVVHLHLTPAQTMAIMAVFMFAAYALFPAGYGLFTFVQTVVVALLIDFSNGPVDIAVEDRIIDTVIGAAIAVLALALWPIREEARARDRLADYAAATADWLDAVLQTYGGGQYDEPELTALGVGARRARADAAAAIDRAIAEPRSRRPDAARMVAVLNVLDDVAGTGTVLTAALDERTVEPEPAAAPSTPSTQSSVNAYAGALTDCLHHLADSLRSDIRVPFGSPPAGGRALQADPLLSGEADLVQAALSRLQ